MAEFELILGIVIGVVIGIILSIAILQSRMNRKVREETIKLFEQQKDQVRTSFEEQYKSHFEQWKAEYEILVQERILAERQDALEKARSVLKGKIGEQMVSLLPDFIEKYEPADARFIGSPIDYIVFKNMSKLSDGADVPLEIVLMEVKTGKSDLNKVQRAIEGAIKNNQVSFDVLRLEIK